MEKLVRLLKKNYLILVILALGLALRMVSLNQSFWMDEAIGALVVKENGFREIILDFMPKDNHPPLYYLILEVTSRVLGYSEISLRLPSVVFGLGTVYFVYLIAKHLSGRNSLFVPLVAALFLATSPLHIYYSQEARMYVPAAFFAAGAFFFFLRRKWVWFSLFLTLLVFTDYLPVLLVPVFWALAFLGAKEKGFWKGFALSHVPLAVLGFFWLPIFFLQLETGRSLLASWPAWKEVAGGATLRHMGILFAKFVLGRISFHPKVLYYAAVLLSSLPFVLLLGRALKKGRENISLWLYFALPVFLGFVLSFVFPAFIYFRFVFVLPAFYLLLSKGAETFSGTGRALLVCAVVLVNVAGWAIYVGDRSQQREDWRGAVSTIESAAEEKDAVIFSFPEPFAPYRWYSQGLVFGVGVGDSVSIDPQLTEEKLLKTVSDKSGVFHFEYLQELTDPAGVIPSALSDEGFEKSTFFDFAGVGVVNYYVRK